MRQLRIPTAFMRGGTSKALFLREEDLPADPQQRDRAILAAYGSPDPYRRQLNGIGGATSSTSKVAIVGPSSRPDADVDYTFGQVGIHEDFIDWGGTCGNISAAVGPFAIEEGWLPARAPITPVRVFNTNTRKVYVAHVPVADGTFEPEGDYAIQGVPGTGSRIVLEYLDPGGGASGKLLPTGHARDAFEMPGLGRVEATVVDAGNPLAVCRLADLGLTGLELPAALDADAELHARLEALRAQAAVACGLAPTPAEASLRSPAIPKVAVVGPPIDYTATDGTPIRAEEIDVVGRIVSMGRVHTSYALTGAIATAVAAVLPGTVVHEVAHAARASETADGRPPTAADERRGDAATRRHGEGSSPLPGGEGQGEGVPGAGAGIQGEGVFATGAVPQGEGVPAVEGVPPSSTPAVGGRRSAVVSVPPETRWVRIGHPAGVLEVGVRVEEVSGVLRVATVSTARTARRLMDGFVYVPASVFHAAKPALRVRA
jgi:2-methylaconitate cis-trans-isomerase PrpF